MTLLACEKGNLGTDVLDQIKLPGIMAAKGLVLVEETTWYSALVST